MNLQKKLVDILTELVRTNPCYACTQLYRIESNNSTFMGIELVLIEQQTKRYSAPKSDVACLRERLKADYSDGYGFTELTGHVVMNYGGTIELSSYLIYDFGNCRLHVLFDKDETIIDTFLKNMQSKRLIASF